MNGSTTAGLVAVVAEDDVAVEIVAAGIRRPLVADEGGEPARIVGLFRRLDRFLPGGAVGRRAGERKERLRERSLGEGNDHFDRGIGALARLDHVVPSAAGGIGQDVWLAGKEVREEAHIVGVVGDDEEIERPRQLGRLSRRRHDLLALGEAIGIARAEPRAERAGVEREHGVEMGVAEERPRREIASRIGRIGRLAGNTFSAESLSSVPTSVMSRSSARAGSAKLRPVNPASRAWVSIRHFICFLPNSFDSKNRHALDHPEHGQAADEIRRTRAGPMRQGSPSETDERGQAQHHGDEKKLPDLDADIEEQRATGM